MKDSVLIEISDILKVFDIYEITQLVKDQINTNYTEDNMTETMANHLKPLYYTYANLTKYNLDEDTKKDAMIRFYSVCRVFVEAITNKFNLKVDKEWLNDNVGNLPSFTFVLYSFFVLDFASNIQEVLLNYVNKNIDELYRLFEEMKIKKDSATLANKKSLSPEISLVISNIYDITKWIFDNMTEDEFFEYFNSDYLPLSIIKKLFDDGNISGNFMEVINEIFQKNIHLKSKTCFKLIYGFRNGDLKDPKANSILNT